MVGKDKGKQGNIAAFVRELNAVFVSGLNLVKTFYLSFKLKTFHLFIY
jgi:ribosomal protein L24